MNPGSPFNLSGHPECPGTDGGPPGFLSDTVDFEYFRVWLVEGSGYGDGSKGGRPPFDPVAMFRVPIPQARHNPSDARMQPMIRDRLSRLRFPGFGSGGPDSGREYHSALPQSHEGRTEGHECMVDPEDRR